MAWAGCVLRTKAGVYALVSEDKWIKMKKHLRELQGLLNTQLDALPRKRSKQICGFMNCVTQTCRYMIPCLLNSLHMTIDGWRENRDSEGWKLPPPKQNPRSPIKTEAAEVPVPGMLLAKPSLVA